MSIQYLATSPNPRILLVSGIHGDEWEVIGFVKEAIEKRLAALPPLLYIPELSPSAVLKKTRLNGEGKDVNRCFFDNTYVSEVKEAQALLEPHHFEFAVTFHEDTSQDHFYLYDTGVIHETAALKHFLEEVRKSGIPLLNGIDDPNDPHLGYEAREGYVSTPPGVMMLERDAGTFESWLIKKIIAQHVLTVEIPGKALSESKRAIVDALFRFVIAES